MLYFAGVGRSVHLFYNNEQHVVLLYTVPSKAKPEPIWIRTCPLSSMLQKRFPN